MWVKLARRGLSVLVMALALLLVAQAVPAEKVALAQVGQPSCPAQSDPGTAISVSAGAEFAIGLPSNHTTGYSWQLAAAPDPSIAYLDTSVYVLAAPPATGQPLAGAGGRECWVFYAAAAGSTTLTLNYGRPFDPPGTAPAQSLTFTVDVQ